eukprot:14146551-Heterocapsa_arctica.AAC.1
MNFVSSFTYTTQVADIVPDIVGSRLSESSRPLRHSADQRLVVVPRDGRTSNTPLTYGTSSRSPSTQLRDPQVELGL